MKQVLELRKAGTVPATATIGQAPAQRPSVLGDADFDQVSGGGGARGGIIDRARND